MKKIIALVLVIALMLTVTSTALAASWTGSGTFYTGDALEKPDSTEDGRYVWNSPITVRVTTMSGSSITVKPVNANHVSMGGTVTITSSQVNTDVPAALTNQNYMHIHLKVVASAYCAGNWSGTYYFKEN